MAALRGHLSISTNLYVCNTQPKGLQNFKLTDQRRCGTGVPAALPIPATGGETGVTVVLITLPLESQSSPSVTSTIPPATGLFPPPVYRE